MIQTVDITPSPRVLRMLGQIDFAPWQCLAELVDNSIDAFIDANNAGSPSASPRIRIKLPTASDLEQGVGDLVVEDNGSGMSLESMTNAVKAGYSGNDPVEKMGLFGMGFNISTARLGRKTEVWSTTAESEQWIGIVIDFGELERTKQFHVPIQYKEKSEFELDSSVHGTKIKISQLEPDRIRPLIWGAGKNKTKRRLGKIYGRIMSKLGIAFSYDGDPIKPWKHCAWDKNRSVPTKDFGNVPAVIEISEELSERHFCTSCWVWLTDSEGECPACGKSENIIERKRTIKGWLGIQRYFDKQHFGIDLIRNGRVIEELDKSMFLFRDANGDEIFEYPIDAIHWGGRIVGELEVDFVRVSHQKDSFDKLDPEWKQVVSRIRGNSPMQPRIADRMGLGRNISPLSKLFSGYRKGSAGLKCLVPGDKNGKGINTGLVAEYRDKFYDDDPDFETDEKLYGLVEQAEYANRGDSSGAKSAGGDFPIDGNVDGEIQAEDNDSTDSDEIESDETLVEEDLDLSRTYRLDELPGEPETKVTVFRHAGNPEGNPFAVVPEGFRMRVDYFPQSGYFEESLETPTDCLIADLAQHFQAISSQSPREWPVSLIARLIRKKYFPDTLSTVSESAEEAISIIDELRKHFDENLFECSPIDLAQIPDSEISAIRSRALRDELSTEEEANSLIMEGKFVRYSNRGFIVSLIENWPQVSCDSRFFHLPFDKVDSSLREDVVRMLVTAVADVLWLAEEAAGSISKDNQWRLRYGRSLASMRLLQNWRV